MAEPVIDILMYHRIADGTHPTRIPPAVFEAQMDAVAETGTAVISLDDLEAAARGEIVLPLRSVILTFDDAFSDFAETAWPILKYRGFPATVYVPTGHVGGTSSWSGAGEPAPIMGWETIGDLAREGVTFGSHTVSHAALQLLENHAIEDELKASRSELEDKLGREIRHFAPPYGRTSAAARTLIAKHYSTSVTTELGSSSLHTSRLALPRLEMYYFRRGLTWKRHLAGRGEGYIRTRKLARRVRGLLLK